MSVTGFELVSLHEAKLHAFIDGDDQNALCQKLVTHSSEIVEGYLGRKLVTRGAITEHHTFWKSWTTLYVREWPLITVTEVAEDIGREYATALVVDTDYMVKLPGGKIIRLSGSSPTTWQTGFEAVRVIYTAGYADTAAVPTPIKDVVNKHFALTYREIERKQQGMTGMSDDLGNFSRIGAAKLTADMKDQLAECRAFESSWTHE